ncbi:MAG TPA: hypothetical protein VGB03_03320 [Acidimicrobiales bacterium]
MDDLEARVRRALAVMTAGVEPSPELDQRVAAVVARPRPPRWRTPTAVAAVVVVVLGAVALFVGRDDERQAVDVVAPPPPAVIGGWNLAEPSPLGEPRRAASVVWTGREAIVWGGARLGVGDGGDLGSADGAAYDPAARRWRRIADAPIANRYRHKAVWTGREMIVWGGVVTGSGGRSDRPDGAAYDPATDTWRRIATSPLPGPSRTSLDAGQAVVWTGREMIAWGRVFDGGYATEGAAYDPATDRWRRVAALPEARQGPPELFATPEGVLASGRVAGVPKTLDPQRGELYRLTAEVDLYDPDTDTWKPLPPSELSPRGGVGPVWSGRELLVPGIATTQVADPYRITARYRPDEQRWVDMAVAPAPPGFGLASKVWAGRELLLTGTVPDGGPRSPYRKPVAYAYDPETDRWRDVPPPPDDLFDDTSGRAVWTGSGVLLWTGTTFAVSR